MSRQANATAIGGFVIGGIVVLLGAVAFFGSGSLFARTEKMVLHFTGSLKGLSVGAPVNFRGVPVGVVSDIVVRYRGDDSPPEIPVYIEVNPDRFETVAGATNGAKAKPTLQAMVDHGLRAQLVLQSFVTGLLEVQLDFHPGTPVRLVGSDDSVPELPTIPSTMEVLTGTLESLPIEDIVADLQEAIQGINQLARSEELATAIRSVGELSQQIQTLVQLVSMQIEPVGSSVVRAANAAVQTLETAQERIDTVERNLSDTLTEYRSLAENLNNRIDPVVSSFIDTAVTLQEAVVTATRTLHELQRDIAPGSRLHSDVIDVLDELTAAARAVRSLADQLERHPETLLRGKGGGG